jgi:hypothetical protein
VQEYACTTVDVLARRTRLAFLNVQAANEATPKIVEIMAKELNWSKERKQVDAQSVLFMYEYYNSQVLYNFQRVFYIVFIKYFEAMTCESGRRISVLSHIDTHVATVRPIRARAYYIINIID